MPYTPINKMLPVTVDIRLQHRYSEIATELSRSTHFNKIEVLRLLQMHYILTKEDTIPMDQLLFMQFMDAFLGVRNVEAVEKMFLISCITNEESLTGSEFVKILSLVLKGKLPDLINFCFEVYTEMTRSPKFIKKEGVLLMAKRNSLKLCKLVNMEKFDQSFVDFVMIEVDKDRDNRISLEDYRKAVCENVAWLQFLGRILPTSTRKEKFMKLFTNRPYINNIQTSVSAMNREKKEKSQSEMKSQSKSASSLSFSSDSAGLVINHGGYQSTNRRNQVVADGNFLTLF
ncbi:uncharacterized protein LOC126549399 [Aphis gossypii]|uniref:uncharacterized protein LOC126549399 n=1 Tax=Aphis gossypii TaxID=80765 RepID=UPI002158BF59|nr:uncharacterized protein LOC126549399 [Aphis gossypii]